MNEILMFVNYSIIDYCLKTLDYTVNQRVLLSHWALAVTAALAPTIKV